MGQNILIATLGESPIVVTSMVKALQMKKGMTIDQLHVIHPQDEKLIDLGYEIVKEHLGENCAVTQCILPFPDANSHETSMEFLQILSGLIQKHECNGDNVYLSLAGGRKNMSALMAATCQFFKCVCGLYHILDKHENNPNQRNFYSIEEFFDFDPDERFKRLSPPTEDLILVEIPYSPLSRGVDLSKLEGEPAAFYGEIFQKKKTDLLDIYLSEEAYKFYTNNHGMQKNLENCFRSMRNPQTLQIHNHSLSSPKTDCLCFKMGDTDERLFYYKMDFKVIIATIVRHSRQYDKIASGNEPLCSRDHPAHIHSNKLKEGNILIVPLGKSPMVVTQTFALLATREGADIEKVIVIHPKDAEIRNGVRLLKTAFRKKGTRIIESIPIEDIHDVASDNDCKIYLKELVSIITKIHEDTPDKSIYLSLSGGRKGMTALTFFAAQQANIDAVYHTLIADVDLEKRIEVETTLETLGKLTREQKAQRLFLHDYDESKFELFRVPVIPISINSAGNPSVSPTANEE